SMLVDFYRNRIDWIQLALDLERTGGNRLLFAYLHYANRELGLPLPAGIESLNHRHDVMYLDAVINSSKRLANYTSRTSLAVLTARNTRERLKRLSKLVVTDSLIAPLQARKRNGDDNTLGANFAEIFKVFCLQLTAVVYLWGHTLLRLMWE